MVESFLDGKVTLHRGDCLDVLPLLAENSIDSIVTDPPYGLQFMGREWDKLWRNETSADQAYVERTKGELTSRARKLPDYSASKPAQMQEFHFAWAKECLRVLKPGAHLLAFSGTRTYHRMACAIEDAGFEIRDQIGWCYGSGFPKSHDVSKGIDRMAGAEREVVGAYRHPDGRARPNSRRTTGEVYGAHGGPLETPQTAPATEAAIQWQGWGTALKPAWEPICLARKPLSESSIAANVLKHGTGGINIDGCRIGTETTITLCNGDSGKSTFGRDERKGQWENPPGRFPANLIHDGSEEVLAGFPESDGQQGELRGTEPSGTFSKVSSGPLTRQRFEVRGDSGSAARFFYEVKKDADSWNDNGPEEGPTPNEGIAGKRFHYTSKANADDRLGSKHPTVKPLDLMQYLVRLVTPSGGICLDPFAGTGTCGEAAWREGLRCVLIEREPEYQADIVKRMGLCLAGPDARNAASVKQLHHDDLPLFGGMA